MCRAATGTVVQKLPQYADKALFINLLAEGDAPSQPAKKSNLDSWIKLLNVPFTVAGDLLETPFAIRKALGQRETTYIVERASRSVLFKKPNVYEALAELDKLP